MTNKLKTLMYITGSGRSGSTLLDMLLSTNPNIAALGEVHRFSMNLGRTRMPYRCTCGSVLTECDFWNPVISKITAEGIDPKTLKTTWSVNENIGENEDDTNIVELIPPKSIFSAQVNVFNILLGLGLKWPVSAFSPLIKNFKEGIALSENSWFLYRKVCEVNHREVVVDGSKSPGRLNALLAYNPYNIPVKVIYLCRDGRAVTHARMKRQGLSMHHAANIWIREHRKIFVVLNKYKGLPLNVKYEDLCSDTQIVLERIYEYAGISGVEGMPVSFRGSSHSLGGNPMRMRTSEENIVLNDSWKTELSKKDLAVFNDIAGKLNAKLGYV
ncbi:MAG: hypothetical protein P1U80_08695 [Pseudomonadales bacterium]|nr:hypothetical protein [Pseudomonadales bacterium]